MGRAPCCDKASVKKGPWSPEEDAKLKSHIEQHGTGGNWIALPQKIGLKRCGKSCRLRWLNYLRPNIKHGEFSEEEDNIICSLYISIGSRWSIIAAQLPGRTDNDIKNYWNTRLKKKLLGKQRKEQALARRITNIKQEIKHETDRNCVFPSFPNQVAFWPEHNAAMAVPIMNSNQHSFLQDQVPLRSLLSQQAPRFLATANPSATLQYPIDVSINPDQFSLKSCSMLSSSSAYTQLPSLHYDAAGAAEGILPGLENLTPELVELGYREGEPLEGLLEGFYGMDMVNARTASTSPAESSSWEDMSSFIFPSMASSYEACPQSLLQDSALKEPKHFALL